MASNDKETMESKENLQTQLAADDAASIQAQVDEVMKKYDRESNTRIWTGRPAFIVKLISVAFSLFCIYVTLWSTALTEVRLPRFLGMILVLGYLHYPIRKNVTRANYIPWYDIIIMVVGAAPFFYFALNGREFAKLGSRITNDPLMVAMAIVGILALMELCRRCVGIPILCVVGVLMIYTFATTRFERVIYILFYTTDGLMNTPITVCARFIVMFIIFGAFLERTGISNYFINLANCVAGASAGGPAKVAVISSALCGMVSGSSVGNTVTTGSVTIPMMKKTGYKPEFAGAVEAAASTGGQIMPPIMGAAAFIMAENTGVPYSRIIVLAILPALLYFTGIYIAVHLEAKKLGLKGIPRENLPKAGQLLPKCYLLTPLIVLVILVTIGWTMQMSAAIAILIALGVGFISNLVGGKSGHVDEAERLTFGKILDALEAGGKGTITVAVACAMAGLVAGCITSTGLAARLITLIIDLSGGVAIIALFLTMLCCIVLGMGVPTTANYCIMAATCAPILIRPEIGVPVICAHFFVFYFGIVADITPPVALAAYAGSAIAKADPMKTGLNATRLAIAAFIVPYIFCLNPVMLFQFDPSTPTASVVRQVIQIVITSLLGLFGVAAALNGFLFRAINPLFRVLIAIGGMGMMIPGTVTDLIGLALVAGIYIYQRQTAKRMGVLT